MPTVAQRDWQYLGSTVSIADSIPSLPAVALGCNCSSDLIPRPETPYAPGHQKKKKKKKKKKKYSHVKLAGSESPIFFYTSKWFSITMRRPHSTL